ncbi:MAG: hypothetical protein ONA90_03075, partial [candidate division KSB1 bacterium]|nr:hypothetical protein [candidate division KSB1 bacterium]
MALASRLTNTSLVLLALNLPCFGQTTLYGGRGLMRVYSAEPIGRGQVFINSYFLAYFDPEQRKNNLGKDYTLSLGLTIGLTKRAELTLNPVLYQDDQAHIWGPPGDTRVGVKYTTPLSFGAVSTGVRFFISLPTAKNHNVNYEPYSSGKVGGGLLGLINLDLTDSFPLVPLKLYFNFGYMDHNFGDKFFSSEEDQYLFGVGLKFPIRSLVFYTEYTGEVFANNIYVSSSENSRRISQGLKVLGPWNLIFDFAADFGLHQPAASPSNPKYQKDYADWKAIVGIN